MLEEFYRELPDLSTFDSHKLDTFLIDKMWEAPHDNDYDADADDAYDRYRQEVMDEEEWEDEK